jgi:polar amino acid transport system substrate-binding protein
MALAVAVLLILFLFKASHSASQVVEDETPVEPLSVATKRIEPFVFLDSGQPTGFSIDLWAAVALELGLEYEYVVVDTVEELLESVMDGTADVAVAAISITKEREEVIDFSFPYFESGLGIMTRLEPSTPMRDIAMVALTPAIWRLFIALFFVIIVAGHVIWLMERHRNEDFSKGYLQGVWDGIWWATVTVTTVGYGDRVPRYWFGRIFALIWMVMGLFIIANFTANVTTELTVSRLNSSISGPGDLPGKRVATVKGSTASQWLSMRGIGHIPVAVIDDAYAMLEEGHVQAVVYDYPILLYHVYQYGGGDLEMAGEPFNSEDYGIAYPQGSPLREDINRALLTLIEDGTYDRISNFWYGQADVN